MIVSAPAPAAIHLPVVSLDPTADPKDPKASQTTAFKNVFDSLTLFEDLPQQGGAKQEGTAAPNSPAKKEPPADSGSGTEEAVVLVAPAASLPKLTLIPAQSATLRQPADRAVPQNNEVLAEATVPQSAPSQSQSDVRIPVTTTDPRVVSAPLAPAASSQYSLLAEKAVADVPIATFTPSARGAAPAKTDQAVTPGAPAKAEVTVGSSETPSRLQPETMQQLPPLASGTAVTTSSIGKPLATKSVSRPSEPDTLGPVSEKPPQVQPIRAQTAQPNIEPLATNIPVRESAAVMRPSASTVTQKAVSAPVSTNVVPPVAAKGPAQTPRIDAPTPRQEPPAKTASENSRISDITPATEQSSASVGAEKPPAGASTASRNTEALADNNNPLASTPLVSNPLVSSLAPAATPVPPAKPAPGLSPGNAPTAPTTGEPTSTPDATALSSAGASSSGSSPNLPAAERGQPQPMLAGVAVAASMPAAPAAFPVARALTDRTSEPSNPSVPPPIQAANAAPKTPLLPQAENFAFGVRMLGLQSFSSHSPVMESATPLTSNATSVPSPTKVSVTQPQGPTAQQPVAPQGQVANDTGRETQPSASQPEKSETVTQYQSDLQTARPTPGVTLHWNEAAVLQTPEPGPAAAMPESNEAVPANLPAATQEAHLLMSEMPRSSASSEILLHLTGDDQSSAAIRVAERAGSVNVSVHASDPVLRESLRSSLGDLSTQLNAQGWKADVLKSVAAPMHSESQQDSHSSEQRSSQQQQSSGGDRQPQRDRRGNGGQWRQELDQQIAGGDAHPGGNR
ncbi:MAG: hypothetical protein ACLPWF_25715 [Bryobacteraceae bacterium]